MSKIIHYKEFKFKFKAALDIIGENEELKSYIPEDWFVTKRGSRNYVWIVLASLKFEYVNTFHRHAIKLRQIYQGQDLSVALLQVGKEMVQLLNDFKFIPSKYTQPFYFISFHNLYFYRASRSHHEFTQRLEKTR